MASLIALGYLLLAAAFYIAVAKTARPLDEAPR